MADLLVDGDLERIPDWYGAKCSKSKLLTDAYEATDFFPMLGKEGKWLHFTAATIRDSKGNIMGAVETIEDITESKRAEEALRKSKEELETKVIERTEELRNANEQLQSELAERRRAEEALEAASAYNRSLIEASLDPLVTISAEGKITDVNAATERVTGCSRNELIGTDFCDYFTDPRRAREGYRQAFRDGSVENHELQIRHRDGCLTPVMYNASVYRNRSGEIVGLFAAARDITDRKRAEEALRESEENYRTSSEESCDGSFYLSRRKNPRHEQQGRREVRYDTKEEVFSLDLELDVYMRPLDRKRILSMVTTQRISEYGLWSRRKMAARCSPTGLPQGHDGPKAEIHHIGVILDITERKKLEEEIQRQRSSAERSPTCCPNRQLGTGSCHEPAFLVRSSLSDI